MTSIQISVWIKENILNEFDKMLIDKRIKNRSNEMQALMIKEVNKHAMENKHKSDRSKGDKRKNI